MSLGNFSRLSLTDSRVAQTLERTGLGLATVKRLAELHGGSVAGESAVGEGSRFAVWLALRADALPENSLRDHVARCRT
jgi:signal transduction histidine kinase